MRIFKTLGCLIIFSIFVFDGAGCANENRNANVNPTPSANTATPNANPANAVSNANVNQDAATADKTDNSNGNTVTVGEVTRISFAKGANSGAAAVVLPPNGAQQFAVEGTYGQKIKVSAASKDAIVKMISGTDRLFESPGGGLIVSINVAGDVVFEVRNASNQELKTTVRAEITDAY